MPNFPNQQRVQYFRSDGLPDADMVDQKAEEQARKLGQVATSQLRRFYEDVTVLKRRIDQAANEGQPREKVFERFRADFKMLRAKAYYAHGRNKRVFPVEFLEFFEQHVLSVRTVQEFDAFCQHFQAVVAFHKFYART
jgi:CRISPR-associated protein Csm2